MSRVKKCSRCGIVAYCSKECQVAHWPIHKAMCDEQKLMHAETGKSPLEKDNNTLEWYSSLSFIPHLVLIQAWRQRARSPLIRVQGMPNPKLASVETINRAVWDEDSYGRDVENMDFLRMRYGQADFDPDVHYYAIVMAGHVGSEDWTAVIPRFRFPCPAEHMDDFVKGCIASSPVIQCMESFYGPTHAHDSRRDRRVRLRGLRGASRLNGKEGIAKAPLPHFESWDPLSDRWTVRLDDGDELVRAKAENVEFLPRRVRLRGLKGAPEMNGLTGGVYDVLGSYDYAAGRWTVTLDGSGKTLKVKPANLTFLDGGDGGGDYVPLSVWRFQPEIGN